MEIWDAYREDGTMAGCDLVRGRKIPKGLYHLVCEVLVKHKDGTYLLMQRDWKKKNYPGLYEATSSGCALKGESSYEAAIRELKEELKNSIDIENYERAAEIRDEIKKLVEQIQEDENEKLD